MSDASPRVGTGPKGCSQAAVTLQLELLQELGKEQRERAMEVQTCRKLWVWH